MQNKRIFSINFNKSAAKVLLKSSSVIVPGIYFDTSISEQQFIDVLKSLPQLAGKI